MREYEPQSKSNFMRNDGYPLYVDTGHLFLDKVEQLSPKLCGIPYELKEVDIDPGAAGLFLASYGLRQEAKEYLMSSEIGVTTRDRQSIDNTVAAGARIYAQGFGDPDFSFHFAPWLAVDALRSVQDEIKLPEEERKSFTLTDYASIIRTEWFKSMLLECAQTSNGVWKRTGDSVRDYQDTRVTLPTVVGYSLDSKDAYEASLDPQTMNGKTIEIATVSLSKVFKTGLSHRLRGKDSVGCPVAPRLRSVDPQDPHVKHLVDTGRMTLEERNHKTVGTQTYDPITRAADALAGYLERYYKKYGQPFVKEKTGLLNFRTKRSVLVHD